MKIDMREFVHLHNHTHNSILDAVATIDGYIKKALADGQKAIALTDHGVMFGALDFYKQCKAAGIKPLIGMEAYIASGSRFDKNIKKGSKTTNYYHVLLLAKNETGYKNLIKLTSLGHTEGFYYRPRIDRELLERYKEGLVCTSACMGGVVSSHIVRGDMNAAREAVEYYKNLFGDDFYLEIQNHNLEYDPLILKEAPLLAKEYNVKLVATNDIHYLEQEHAVAHNVLLYIRDANAANTGTFDVKELRYKTPEFYFKTKKQMIELFEDFPDAIDSTVEIADKCNLELDLKKLYMPEFPIPDTSKAKNLEEYLRELVYEGLNYRFKEITTEIQERADYELEVINNMGFPGYFLIVWDFIRAARELGVPVGPGRGSAAGSLVAYALKITNVDPLPYDLLFERFLNPERVSMPDIDIDFADDKRDQVIEYVKNKYGENAVAQIITFGTLSTRAALTDIGRVLGVPLATVKSITKKIPVVRGKVTPIAQAVMLPDLKWVTESGDQKLLDLIEYGKILENKFRNTSTHAAGVVIAPGDITDYVPLYQPSKMKNQSLEVATQYSMNDLEDAGLLKMDFLGLRTLSIIQNTLDMIEQNSGQKIDIDEIDFHDQKTFNLLSSGSTLGIFQFESGGMQEYLKKLKPQNLEEITAMNALYRPGPMENIPEFIERKHGRKPITYLHPKMEKTLKSTYGIIVYQEQVMLLVQEIGGFTLGEADNLRRAMSKKKIKEMEQQKPKFVEGAAKNGIKSGLAEEIFHVIEKFADYGFNKSHSLAYSYLAFQTAWLKAHYPAEFLAANMTAEINTQSKIVELRDEAKLFGIKLLPPDINKSGATFTAANDSIYFGMAAIRNVGISAVEHIVEARAVGPFVSFFDFLARVDINSINRRSLEALIYSGAFDSLYTNKRSSLIEAIDLGLDYARAMQSQDSGMDSLFAGGAASKPQEPELPESPEFTEKERLEKEKEFLNFYVSGHPLHKYLSHIASLSNVTTDIEDIDKLGDDTVVCGIISEVKVKLDKHQKNIAFIMLEDFKGKCECILWNKTYQAFADSIVVDSIVFIKGKPDKTAENLKLIVDEVLPIEEAVDKYGKGYNIWINLDDEKFNNTEDVLTENYSRIFSNQSAKTKIKFNIRKESINYKNLYFIDEAHIDINHESLLKLGDFFGMDNVRLL